MDIHLADDSDVPLSGWLIELLPRLAAAVLQEAGLPEHTEAGIRLVSDREMALHNQHFLGQVGPTDVLALPIEELQPRRSTVLVPGGVESDGPPLNVGDVMVAPAYVQRQATQLGVSPDEEMALMVVHGMLHLLGYDHRTRKQARRMESRERALLAGVGMTRR